mmetsp:Transcript_29492/g.29221  ORF Transcript_29492/g.29221 Transcript_29492/m.29221 type:complete len:1237 (+) Transcript_29492:328-4038(+)
MKLKFHGHLEREKKIYEEETLSGEVITGNKSRIICNCPTVEHRNENYWKKPDDKGDEKYWTIGRAIGSEKSYEKDGTSWGENTLQDQDKNEKKTWKKEPEKEQEHVEGTNGKVKWVENRVKEPNHEHEDKLWTEKDKKWGEFSEKKPNKSYRVEWEGEKPTFGGNGLSADRLSDIYEKQLKLAKESETTLAKLSGLVPSTKDEVEKLAEILKNVQKPDFDNPDSLEEKIKELIDIENKQEALKQIALEALPARENLTDKIDKLENQTKDILNNATREASLAVQDGDDSKVALEAIKNLLEELAREIPENNSDALEKISKRLGLLEKIEKVRKDAREKTAKEVRNLKDEVDAKANELEQEKQKSEELKAQHEAQIQMLQDTLEQNEKLVDQLTQESTEKNGIINQLKDKNTSLQNEVDALKEQVTKLEDDLDKANQEIKNLKRLLNEKDNEIQSMKASIENYEKLSQEAFKGDQGLLDSLKAELAAAKEDLANKAKTIFDLEEQLKSKEDEIQGLKNNKAGLEGQVENLNKEIEDLKAQLLALQDENKELQEKAAHYNPEEKAILLKIIEDKDSALSEIEDQLADAKKYHQLYLLIKEEKDECEQKIQEQDVDISELERKIRELTQENEELKYKTRQLDQLIKTAAALENENQKLHTQLAYLEEFSGDKSKEVQRAIEELTSEISKREAIIKDLNDQIEALKAKLNALERKHNLAMNRNFLIRFINAYKNKQNQSFFYWRSLKPVRKSIPEETKEPELIEIPENMDESDRKNYAAAAKGMMDENRYLIETNIITKSLEQAAVKGEKPLSYLNVFKFLEDLMDKKYETDRKDLTDRRQPRSMTEFMMEYITRNFGIQSLAFKFLGQFIPGLQQVYREGNKYAIFYSRLLQVFHPEPVPYNLAIYLVRARIGFNPLIEKLEKARAVQGKKQTGAPTGTTHGRAAYDLASTGGLALLSDVIDLILVTFATDKESGTLALELIKPEAVGLDNYVAYMITHKMAKMGKTPEMIFNVLDKDGGGSISTTEFIAGVKQDLDLWISDANIQQLLQSLDKDGSGELEKTEFTGRINMKYLMECNRNPDWVVSKASYLIALVEVFKARQRKDAAHLYSDFSRFNSETINLEQFTQLVQQYDPNLSPEQVSELFTGAGDGKEAIEAHEFSKIVMKYGIAGYGLGAFLIPELMASLTERKIVTDVDLKGIPTGSKAKGAKEEETKSQVGTVSTTSTKKMVLKKPMVVKK